MSGESAGKVRLLDAEPSLARGIERHLQDEARETLVADILRINAGPWEEGLRPPESPLFLGYLVLEGAFTREIIIAGRPSIELLGPGDLIRPWILPEPLEAMHVTAEWSLISEGHVAVINEDFHRQAQAFPSILTVLMDRVVARARWLGFQVALCQIPRIDLRLLLLFRYLAERWGIEGPRGSKIAIRLSHRNLAAMIGARRPKVSSALTALADQDLIEQDGDGTWTFFAAEIDPMAILASIDEK
ncbi:MAG: Crp/Fnr family transcriptional regulator [Solirubrobacterales bacterium]|nr:Crp/Fnr family transcriptional regulator [Solirubrobacterales bacterium]